MKSRILIFVFGSENTAKTFAKHKVLNQIHELGDFQPVIVVRTNTKNKSSADLFETFTVGDIKSYEGDLANDKNYLIWMWSTMIIYLFRSKAFKMRAYRRFCGKYRKAYFQGLHQFVLNLLKLLTRKDNFWLYLSLIPPLNFFVNKILLNKIVESNQLTQILRSYQPLGVALVSNGAESLIEEVRLSSSKLNIPWFMIVDNWDNVSSKSVFAFQPDLLLVWSRQQKNLAMKIHRFSGDDIKIVGSQRLGEYWASPHNINLTTTVKYKLLYVGQQEPYEELVDLYQLISNSKSVASVKYRPHPLRIFERSEIEMIRSLSRFGRLQLSLSPDQNNFFFLKQVLNTTEESPLEALKSVDCVVGPPTTMILESTLLRKLTFVVSRDDKLHRTTSSRFWENYEHFFELKNISFLFEVNDLQSFDSVLQRAITNFDGITKEDIEILNYLVDKKSSNYVINLNKIFKEFFETKI